MTVNFGHQHQTALIILFIGGAVIWWIIIQTQCKGELTLFENILGTSQVNPAVPCLTFNGSAALAETSAAIAPELPCSCPSLGLPARQQPVCDCPACPDVSPTQREAPHGYEVHLKPGSDEVTCVPKDCIFYSQMLEDRTILSHMMVEYREKSNQPNVTRFPFFGPQYVVLEIGGLDGIRYSNSYFFEHSLGWRAVLFEPSRLGFPMLQKNRPRAVTLNLAVCKEDGVVKYLENSDSAVSGIPDEMSPGFKIGWHGNTTNEHEYDVMCGAITKYLQVMGILQLDIFFLDVEGGELSVLHGLDTKIISVHYLIVEMDGGNPEREEKIRILLIDYGFQRLGKIGAYDWNELFVNTTWT